MTNCSHGMLVRHGQRFHCYLCHAPDLPAPRRPDEHDTLPVVFKPTRELPPDASIDAICHQVEIDLGWSPARCDFCGTPEVIATTCFYTDALLLLRKEPRMPTFVDDGAWLACPSCIPLVERRDVDGLVDRITKVMVGSDPGYNPAAGRARLTEWFDGILAHIQGRIGG